MAFYFEKGLHVKNIPLTLKRNQHRLSPVKSSNPHLDTGSTNACSVVSRREPAGTSPFAIECVPCSFAIRHRKGRKIGSQEVNVIHRPNACSVERCSVGFRSQYKKILVDLTLKSCMYLRGEVQAPHPHFPCITPY